MTEEEKFKQIQESRKVASEAKGEQETKTGVESDPADKKVETKEGDYKQQETQTGDKTAPKKEYTESEKQQHAMAAMRTNFKRENEALKREIAELKKWKAEAEAKSVKPKTRDDFENDEEFGKYLQKNLEENVYKRLQARMNEEAEKDSERSRRSERLSSGLESLEKGLTQKVFTQLENPDSEMSMILNDERGGKLIADTISESDYGAELLSLLYNKPEIFKEILALPAKKQEYRLYQLEDTIENMRKSVASKQQSDEEKRKRAESLPATGAFGLNGNGNTDISGLSTRERVERYKAEMRKI